MKSGEKTLPILADIDEIPSPVPLRFAKQVICIWSTYIYQLSFVSHEFCVFCVFSLEENATDLLYFTAGSKIYGRATWDSSDFIF